MTTRQQRDFLKVHLLETQRMREMVGDHPVMSIALAERERMFSEQLAAISLESGDSLSDMSPAQATAAYSRVAETTATDEAVTISGVLKGVLLASWKFNFAPDGDDVIEGRIDESLTQDQVIAFNQDFFNQQCRAALVKTSVVFRNGRVRTTYRLMGLEAIAAPSHSHEADER
jgi:hypothetical protein